MQGLQKVLTGAAMCLASLVTVTAPVASAPSVAVPVLEMAGDRPVHIAVKSIYVHDDADKGVYGCGDFQYIKIDLDGETVIDARRFSVGVVIDPIFGPPALTETYCSDSNYVMPIDLAGDPNRFITAGNPGDNLDLSGSAREIDNFDNRTIGYGDKTITVPAPGGYVDKVLEVEGANGAGHMRLSITIRMRTF